MRKYRVNIVNVIISIVHDTTGKYVLGMVLVIVGSAPVSLDGLVNFFIFINEIFVSHIIVLHILILY